SANRRDVRSGLFMAVIVSKTSARRKGWLLAVLLSQSATSSYAARVSSSCRLQNQPASVTYDWKEIAAANECTHPQIASNNVPRLCHDAMRPTTGPALAQRPTSAECRDARRYANGSTANGTTAAPAFDGRPRGQQDRNPRHVQYRSRRIVRETTCTRRR